MTKKIDGFERVGELFEELPEPRPEAREAARAQLVARFEAPARHGAHSRRRGRRRARLVFAAACAAALVAATMVLTSSDVATPAAYAVETPPGGGLKIEIYRLDDPEGVEQVLEEAGVASQVSYLTNGTTCREPHYKPSMATSRTLEGSPPQPWAGYNYESLTGPPIIYIGGLQQQRNFAEEMWEAWRHGNLSKAEQASLWIEPAGFRSDQTLIMSSEPIFAGHYPRGRVPANLTQVRVAEGEVGPCEPVPVADVEAREAPIRAPEGGWDFSEVPYAGWGFGPGY